MGKHDFGWAAFESGGSGGGGGGQDPAGGGGTGGGDGQDPGVANPGGQDPQDDRQDRGPSTDQLKRESQKYRQERDELKTKLQEYEDRDKTESQRLQAEKDRLEGQHREANERAIRAEIRADAFQIGRKLGIVDTDDAIRLLPDDTPSDDNGRPTDLEGALTKLVEAKPWLLEANRPAPATGGGGPTKPEGGAGAVDEAAITPGIGRLRAAFSSSSTDKK